MTFLATASAVGRSRREVNSSRTIASGTAAPLRRGPCRKLAAGLGPAARPGTATSIFTPLSSMRWNYRAHLSSEFDVLLMLEHELVAEDELDGRHPSMSSMVPDATASTTKHGGPLETWQHQQWRTPARAHATVNRSDRDATMS